MNWTHSNVANGTACSASITDSIQVKAIKTILLSTVMVAALVGNIFIITIVYKKKTMRKTTNIFIANMAASDMFIAAVVIPRILTELYIGPWRWLIDGPLGVITCKFCFFLADFSVCISILSHAAIAIDRFWAIVYSLRLSPITSARRKYIIGSLWLFSFILHTPILYSFRLQSENGETVCRVSWSPFDKTSSRKVFFGVIFVTVLCIPVLLMTILYTWLVISLITKRNLSEQPLSIRRQRRKEDIRVLRKVVILLIVFLISLTPITVFALLSFYFWGAHIPCDKWTQSFICHFIFLSNCAVNPCLGIALNDSYRSCIIRALYVSKRIKRPKSQTQTTEQNRDDTRLRTCSQSAIHTEDLIMESQQTSNNAT